ncbi:hypothetical protein BpHYR1_010123 [Brachionus plicatilis]|uniref:Uncharacterized protein n=1 Tax=Brachionus plicatilis TaxID=10195 RepID=A0A3M7R8X5_BRAPC|nr:hypothetical protein BpHYR1_010123 [Brachionus plicatilis]
MEVTDQSIGDTGQDKAGYLSRNKLDVTRKGFKLKKFTEACTILRILYYLNKQRTDLSSNQTFGILRDNKSISYINLALLITLLIKYYNKNLYLKIDEHANSKNIINRIEWEDKNFKS